MKKSNTMYRVAGLFIAAMITTGFHAWADDAKKMDATASGMSGVVYKAVPEQSEVKWTGKKVTGSHHGTIQLKSGQLTAAGNVVTGGTFAIDMTTIKDLDLTDPEYNGKLIGHLKSDDFFGVEKFPTSTYEITKLTPIAGAKEGAANYTVDGNLTIKGITHPATFQAAIAIAGDTIMASASEIKVDRTLYNIRYGSKKFFESIGDKAISDDFTLSVALMAKKS